MANFNRQRGFIYRWSGEQITKGLTETKPPLELSFHLRVKKLQHFFIGREATSKDTKIVAPESRDRLSIEANKANCGTSGRTQRWQFYNDTDIGCVEEGGVETTSIQESIEKYSTQEGVDTLLGTGNP
jgi:hypothetical protein